MGGSRTCSPLGTLINISLLYLDIPGAGGAAAAPDKGEVSTGNVCLHVHLQTVQIHGCTLIFQVRVVVLLLQMKERSFKDTLPSRYNHKQFRAVP